jgi:hypothetical protein
MPFPTNFRSRAQSYRPLTGDVSVQNRISARRAAVLTYITNQLLHSLVAIKRETDAQPIQWDWDLPAPKRDQPDETAPKAEATAGKPV